MDVWALAIAYWLHMAATVLWIGGLLFQALILQPIMMEILAEESSQRLLYQLRRRFQPLAWLSLAVLVGTGLVQMSANPNYLGFIDFGNSWSQAILAKHLAIGGMVAVAAYQTWGLAPQLERALLLRSKAEDSSQVSHRLHRLTLVNVVLSLLVLALTALARTA